MNSQNANQKKKKGNPIVLALVLAYVVITAAVGELGTDILAVIIGPVIVAVIIAAVVISKKKGSGSAQVHSHDRIEKSKDAVYKPSNCKGIEHWVTQLDGFLAAGIIEKDEYKVLLNSYRKNYDENGNYLY